MLAWWKTKGEMPSLLRGRPLEVGQYLSYRLLFRLYLVVGVYGYRNGVAEVDVGGEKVTRKR